MHDEGRGVGEHPAAGGAGGAPLAAWGDLSLGLSQTQAEHRRPQQRLALTTTAPTAVAHARRHFLTPLVRESDQGGVAEEEHTPKPRKEVPFLSPPA
jgi:hypothetical protein